MHDLTVIATDEATASCRKRHTTTVSSPQQPSPHHTSVPLSPRPSASRGRGRARGRSRTIPVSFSQPPLTSRWTKAAHRPGRDLLHFFLSPPFACLLLPELWLLPILPCFGGFHRLLVVDVFILPILSFSRFFPPPPPPSVPAFLVLFYFLVFFHSLSPDITLYG